ncbi:hypothetical protein CLAVI_000846 [Candidatus Clavichlamydia salmonicola]|uniref:alpha/beta hydrolase n=1 Tax=Candidatus Clavichlamydia salmonicola TaxID=469812 RepID=UPI001890C2FA|nr:hypothetical protein [Candidatus Clavichlamydia salmonicola]MBF5051208.1 hypothetical protein [Candidatus Clavichlamydia salmonicola]
MNFIKKEIAGLTTYIKEGSPGFPTVVALHGFGSSAQQIVSSLNQVGNLNNDITWIIPQGPINLPVSTHGEDAHAWFSISFINDGDKVTPILPQAVPESCDLLEKFFQELNHPLDNIILSGFSQGAMLTAEFASTRKEVSLLGIIMSSGTLLNVDAFMARDMLALPFLITHGTNDPFFSLDKALILEKAFKTKGCEGTVVDFPGGHEITMICWVSISLFIQNCSKIMQERSYI